MDEFADTTRPLIDGLALPAFAGMEDAMAARGAIGLIHHPAALETGYAELIAICCGASSAGFTAACIG